MNRTIKIASYNIRKAVGLDWKRTPGRIHDVLAELNADIVILQEADRRFGSRAGVLSPDILADELDYKFVDVAKRPLSHGWHGNAILYRCPLQPISATTVEIPCLEPRGAVSAVFDLQHGQRLQVIGTHLSLFRSVRKKQIRAIIDHAKTDASDLPTVIGGDFNERHSKTLEDILPPNYRLVTPGLSFHAARPMLNFDRFLIKGAELSVKNASVHTSDNSRIASDHLPVVMDINISSTK